MIAQDDIVPGARLEAVGVTATQDDVITRIGNDVVLTVAVSTGTTTNGADILKAGSYKSTITITVAPI